MIRAIQPRRHPSGGLVPPEVSAGDSRDESKCPRDPAGVAPSPRPRWLARQGRSSAGPRRRTSRTWRPSANRSGSPSKVGPGDGWSPRRGGNATGILSFSSCSVSLSRGPWPPEMTLSFPWRRESCHRPAPAGRVPAVADSRVLLPAANASVRAVVRRGDSVPVGPSRRPCRHHPRRPTASWLAPRVGDNASDYRRQRHRTTDNDASDYRQQPIGLPTVTCAGGNALARRLAKRHDWMGPLPWAIPAVADDILDCTQTSEQLGKTAGKVRAQATSSVRRACGSVPDGQRLRSVCLPRGSRGIDREELGAFVFFVFLFEGSRGCFARGRNHRRVPVIRFRRLISRCLPSARAQRGESDTQSTGSVSPAREICPCLRRIAEKARWENSPFRPHGWASQIRDAPCWTFFCTMNAFIIIVVVIIVVVFILWPFSWFLWGALPCLCRLFSIGHVDGAMSRVVRSTLRALRTRVQGVHDAPNQGGRTRPRRFSSEKVRRIGIRGEFHSNDANPGIVPCRGVTR